ncbi:MAG: hypothetical protein MZU91_10120 [Desulfosudis oleivorans]|nr:hypothetical protein [Desulfosudis oleivorans]
MAGEGEEKLLTLLGITNSQGSASTDYRLLMENRYLSPGFILPYSAARGCWWRKCAFCPEKAEGNPYLPLSFRRRYGRTANADTSRQSHH